MKIDDYFVSAERSLNQNPQISKIEDSITILTSDDYNGLIRCRVIFWDGSFLDIYEVVSTELGFPCGFITHIHIFEMISVPFGTTMPLITLKL